ncbi:MAG TPA: diguanylate cyclase [Acidimicrobiales bacterium]|nr:diguanylate cyclase [Acidimicrobiales bacterium]
MAEFLSQRLLGRLGAVLFALSGLVTLANLLVPSEATRNIGVMAGVGTFAMVVGGVCWVLPWHRWPKWSTLPLVAVAFAMISAGGIASHRPWTYAIYWVVAFVWLGVAHKRWTATMFVPLATALYLLPFLVHDDTTVDAIASVGVVMPVCLLVAESLAWVSGMLRQAERLDLRRMSDMESLLEATVSLARQSDATGAANLVAELAVKLLRADSAVVLLADPSTDALRGTGGYHWQGRVQTLEATWLDQPARAALTSSDVTVHDGGIAGQLTRAAKGAPAMFLPLQGSSGVLGLVMVTYPSGTKLQLDGFASGLARTFATQASLAFERLRATQVLVDESMRDALTGVGNRRRADALLDQLKPGDAVAIVDMDHFKRVNDDLGHAAGDEVLVSLASFLDKSLRDGDAVARYGGEEFIVVLRQAGDYARAAMERLLDGWHNTSPVTTFSAGVAVHATDSTAGATLAAADAALYRAKRAGRDCVRHAESLDGVDAMAVIA